MEPSLASRVNISYTDTTEHNSVQIPYFFSANGLSLLLLLSLDKTEEVHGEGQNMTSQHLLVTLEGTFGGVQIQASSRGSQPHHRLCLRESMHCYNDACALVYVSLDIVSFSVFNLLLFGELNTTRRERTGAAVYPQESLILLFWRTSTLTGLTDI